MTNFTIEEWNNIWNSLKHKDDYEKIVEAIITKYTSPGDIILDPLAGKGETLSVCHSCNRNGIGLENNAKNFAVMQERMKKQEGQLKLDCMGAKEKCKQLVLHSGAGDIDRLWQEYFLPVVDLAITRLRKDVLNEAATIIEKVSFKLKLNGVIIMMIPLDLEREKFITELRKKGLIVAEDLIVYSSQAVWILIQRN